MSKYEYMTIVLNERDIEGSSNYLNEKLNQYGKNGWKLVTATSQPRLGSTKYNLLGISQKVTLIFKRAFIKG